jgi:hypothetical protein
MRKLFITLFILTIGISFSQSKKEQIEILKNRIDSLNVVAENERNFNYIKEQEFNSKISGYESQITSLKTTISNINKNLYLNELKNDKLSKAIYYKDFNSIEELNEIQKVIKPSLTKSDFYKYYFEKLTVNELKKRNGFNSYSDTIISKLISMSGEELKNMMIYKKNDILKNVNKIDSLFNKKKLNIEDYFDSDFYVYLASNYYCNDYYVDLKDWIIVDNLVNITYNVSGMDAGNRTNLFKIEDNDVNEIDLSYIFQKVAMKMQSHVGKGCYINYNRTGLIINKIGNEYEITQTLYKMDDSMCCPSYFVKFTTKTFYDFDEKTIMYQKNIENSKWLRY